MLEYDNARSGSFAPLKTVPEDKTVVLGLVSTKTSHLETVATLKSRILKAGQYIALERLALSPQCGFASSIIGNQISISDQNNKLRRVVETAREVWHQT
ncbi:MAG: vitamin-B12 independent methionine synthase [bacterium]|nr:vitamin-B12 independent methionine synthase [bacterium]